MDMQAQRPITSGSRQAPDPYDQYLESRGLYRKHTARDASSLFRVIAEQMYDTQMLHYEIRLECVRFMTLKRRIFEKDIPGDFDSYMQDMSKPKTYGTMTELRAMSCLYRRNVILYEPYNMGTSVIFNRRYPENFRVFFNNENHFDSVFEVNYIETAAICQSISFKLLYQQLFKLPDVSFAVEIMLHPHSFDWDKSDVQFNDQGYMIGIQCSDGHTFALDLPENTNCILENFMLCNFHSTCGIQSNNSRKTSRRESKQQEDRKLPGTGGHESNDHLPMCPNRLESCVRQLLYDGITPFPYKVAKSMDPFMYRNIEFDCWNDMRKEAKRYNVYVNDYNFKVGAKCKVELEYESEMYTCHIQSISKDKTTCVVFAEMLGQKLWVPYESLHPLPPEEYRPWALPYRYQRQMNRVHLPKFVGKANKISKWKKNKVFEMGQYFEPSKCDLMPMQGYIPLENCYQEAHHQEEQQADHRDPDQQNQNPVEEQTDLEEQPQKQQQQQQQQQQRSKEQRAQGQKSNSNQNQETAVSAAPPPAQYMNYLPLLAGRPSQAPPPWPSSPLALSEEFQFPMPGTPHPPSAEGCVYMPFGGYGPPPPGALAMPGAHPFMPLPPPPLNVAGVGEPRRSLHLNGEDLPVDVSTLRYFYNMGVDMHWRMAHQAPPEDLSIMAYNHQNNTDQQPGRGGGTGEDLLAAEATPPSSPEAANAAEQQSPPLEKAAYSKRTMIMGKGRGKRPEQLHDLKDQLGPAAFLPTPTPSPSSNGSQFSFYTSPPPHHLMSPPRLLQPPPPPIFFHKAGPPQLPGTTPGQNPYAWGIGAPLVAPYEVINNFNMEPLAQPQPQQQRQQAPVPMPIQSQPAAVYAAPRHH
ncbi:protein ovarian tumor locus isoform X1 [Drosophila elegans]|uniref:protein ovarian tumor locus isoform X1 n=1 Tax=Drosophila elegans TaxID=30023 RepID=UPI001BC8550F|nr:protein ovarian tumor locus isoform X1 [Drosophila elegans]